MMAANRTLRNNPGTIEDVIHRENRRMDGISRIITRLIVIAIAPLTVLFCNYPLAYL